MGKHTLVFAVSLAAILFMETVAQAETNVVSVAATQSTEDIAAWGRHVVQAYQQLQDEQQTLQRSVEEARQDSEAATKRNTEMLETKLKELEDAVTTQRQREVETLQSSHRLTLIIVGLFAGVGFLGMFFFAVFLLRSMNRQLSGPPVHSAGAPLGHGYATAALGAGDTQLVTVDPAQQASQRFLSTIERLEKRIHELETTAQPPDAELNVAVSEPPPPAAEGATAAPRTTVDLAARVALLMGKGLTLLNLQQADRAIECFDEVIALDGTNAEAFVKKGTALEKLGRLDEAIGCYDHAIAVDTSMTMAYLCKGGVFNRLERYGDALQCYEQALRAQHKAGVT
ncbi:MAG TPA: tetratricopeptide repeat protein [Verrucomicrobiae bacterium]|nr:tetratricopeptide repeat protein [Verrucomicrobiae bacterium]